MLGVEAKIIDKIGCIFADGEKGTAGQFVIQILQDKGKCVVLHAQNIWFFIKEADIVLNFQFNKTLQLSTK